MPTPLRLREATIGAVLVLLLVALTACSAAGKDVAQGVAFVIGARSNSPAVDPDRLLSYIPASSDQFPAGSVVSVTGIDGSEDGVAGPGFELADMLTSADTTDLLLIERGRIAAAIPDLRAETSEANVLGAIATAARSIAAVPGTRTLVIADSMLATFDPLAFQQGLLTASAEDVLAGIPVEQLPPLDGVHVVILDQGTTAAPQQPLPQADRTALRSIWESILLASGAADITYDDRSTPLPPPVGAPTVATVEPSTFDTPQARDCRLVIPESAIRFVGDEAVFESTELARGYLDLVAEQLAGCDGTITIQGTTASASLDEEFNRSLSLDRAILVRSELAPRLAVAVDSIRVEGLGTDFPGFVEDRPGGVFDPMIGAKNRTVIISYAD